MIRYQYQLLRYQPDALSGEFVLMGYVLLCPSQQVFAYYLTPFLERAESFFAAAPPYFKHTLRQGLKSLDTLLDDFQVSSTTSFLSLESITGQLLPPNENALCFAPQQEAVAVDLEQAQAFLKQRIEKYILVPQHGETVNDHTLQVSLRQAFKRHHVLKHLKSHQISLDQGRVLEYPHAWKNGCMNLYQATSFDYAQRGSVEKKVDELHGKLALLEHSSQPETYKIHLVSAFPRRIQGSEKATLTEMIETTLDHDYLKLSRVMIALIPAEEIDILAEQTRQQIVAHLSGQT